MGHYAKQLNKALLPLDSRAIITHIIERFPANAEFVIGVGYQQDQVRQYLGIAHPDRVIIYVEVDNYEGPGSGPGYSLSCCQSLLQQPFYFVSCDTLWDNELPSPANYNWLGVAPVPATETERYCNLRVDGGRVRELRDKERVNDKSFHAFVGLCYIHDHAIFWQALGSEVTIAGERQVSNGIRALISACEVKPFSVTWTDVGDFEKYKKAVLQFADFDFSKSDEFFYSVRGKIIKYFVDTNITDRRVAKASLNPDVFPPITDHVGGFYAYPYQPGETLYQYNSVDILQALLNWLETAVWKTVVVNEADMRRACRQFYQEKTLKRLEAYDRKYPAENQPMVINGQPVPPLQELLPQIPWAELERGVPRFIHGDLQFDNILYDKATASFKLLDWRQDFAGEVAFGDLYYDFAKLRGGIILNYDYIKRNLLGYAEEGGRAFFDFAQRYQTSTYLKILDQHVAKCGLDVDKVRLLVACIYLNMAPLHHYPFDKMLHALGRILLAEELERRKCVS